MRIVLLLGLLSLAPGCVLHTGRGHYPRPAPSPAPPPPPRAMSYDEAVSLGLGQCRSRGYRCELKEAHLKGHDVWKVKFQAFAPGARGHLHLDYDAYSRALLKVDEKVKSKGDDWDDDDDGRGHGHGRGKKKGHAKWDD
ncbi:hypothetical protein JRI60_07755 [Archangium violaceum]|uniref:hypothetical protein n=1 Tax=Archangium violaceum TaxID=83451 RepID=UPI001950D43F|nr:hypothetical protein [Archangium violaceum]QRN98915.1 hypothetical protein JRI60_07755 [Archangium violaceum]